MSSETSFSYSFSFNDPPARPPETPLIALDLLSEFPLPGEKMLARNPRNGREMVLPAEVMNALSYCTRFRSLEEHVEDLLQGGPADPGRSAAIHSVVKSVHEGGLFLSASEVCDQFAPAVSAAGVIGQPVVAIITWERPEALRRLLKSILVNSDLSRIETCIVVDDSRDETNSLTNREITTEADQQAEIDIEYFGADEARAFMGELIRNLPHLESEIRFALDREAWKDQWTAGIARNYCQLLSVGKPLIVCDDDVICDVYEAPYAKSGVEFSERTREAAFFRNRDTWPAPATEGSRDPFARHMQVLGLTIPQALGVLKQEKPDQASLKPASTSFAGRLNRKVRILTTECASLGDPGTGNNRWVATLPPQSVDHLLQHPGLLHSALETRNCWLGRMRPAFVPNSNISQITGSDNREFLPPYFPIMRGQDRIFGETNQLLFPETVALDLPWAAPHLPMNERSWADRDNDFGMPEDFPGDLTCPPTTLKDGCYAPELEKRVDYLARFYFDLAACPDRKLFEAWAEDWLHSWSIRLALLQEQIAAAPETSGAWNGYLDQAYRQTRDSKLILTDVGGLKSSDLNLSGHELAAFWRKAWKNHGRTLLAWHEIRAMAQNIRRPARILR